MWGTSNFVNFFWLLFSTLVIGQNFKHQKKTLSKWSLNTFYRVNGFSVGFCILCVKMTTFLCRGSTLPHNTKKCFPPYPDHYLTFIVLQITPVKGIREIFASGIRNSGILSKESGILGFGIRNTAQGIRNPTDHLNPESKNH